MGENAGVVGSVGGTPLVELRRVDKYGPTTVLLVSE